MKFYWITNQATYWRGYMYNKVLQYCDDEHWSSYFLLHAFSRFHWILKYYKWWFHIIRKSYKTSLRSNLMSDIFILSMKLKNFFYAKHFKTLTTKKGKGKIRFDQKRCKCRKMTKRKKTLWKLSSSISKNKLIFVWSYVTRIFPRLVFSFLSSLMKEVKFFSFNVVDFS